MVIDSINNGDCEGDHNHVVQRINDAGSQVNSEHGSNEKHGGGIHLLPFP
jgi:hypothetical protein